MSRHEYSHRFRVKPGEKAHLSQRDTSDTVGIKTKKEGRTLLARNVAELERLQHLLYADGRHALLIVLQGMDAGGKDGTIRHVMSSVNPQGCRVTSFKQPTPHELKHDFLWRVHQATPALGEIGVFNRSHYEDVLIVRVRDIVPKRVWSKRYAHINNFEKLLTDSGVHILKFFLHISKEEQKQRFLRRQNDPSRNWKLSPSDANERALWDAYMAAYEDALTKCSTDYAPWFVIPSDKKWFRNLAISQIIADKMASLDLRFPEPTFDVSTITFD
jgi:PPK2 family polyphosphate:nucleotide phosphotransferase